MKPRVRSDGAYEAPDGSLAAGATLGGPALSVKLLANGAIDCVHSIAAGGNLITGFDVYHFDGSSGLRLAPRHSRFILRPECQIHRYRLAERVEVARTTFVAGDPEAAPVCYVFVRIRNGGHDDAYFDTIGVARLKSSFTDDVEARWDEGAHALLVRDCKRSGRSRAIISSVRPASWTVTEDHARVVADRWPGPFAMTAHVGGVDPLAVFHIRTVVRARSSATFWFGIAPLPDGNDAVGSIVRCPSAAAALSATQTRFRALLDRTIVLTPVAEIDLGVHWAKANMIRTMRHAPTGPGFTNDPVNSTACVGRDAAWFVHGCDWLAPDFSRALLRQFAARQERDGKIVEFFDLRDGSTCDDGLNVNDNTPLFVLAVWHHALATGDRSFLEELYPAARRAVEQLLRNRDERGLVRCSSNGTGARGIVGWRNIIDGYRISGATTEINSEVFAALHKMSALARIAGDRSAAQRFEDEASALRLAIELHLRIPAMGCTFSRSTSMAASGPRSLRTWSSQPFSASPTIARARASSSVCAKTIFGRMPACGQCRVMRPNTDRCTAKGCSAACGSAPPAGSRLRRRVSRPR